MFKKHLLWIFLFALFLFAQPPPLSAAGEGGADCKYGMNGIGDVVTIQDLSCVILNAMSVVISFFALVGFCMFVYASFKLLVSSGQPQHLEEARKTMFFAILGLALALSATVIINLISYFTGVDSFLTIQFIN